MLREVLASQAVLELSSIGRSPKDKFLMHKRACALHILCKWVTWSACVCKLTPSRAAPAVHVPVVLTLLFCCCRSPPLSQAIHHSVLHVNVCGHYCWVQGVTTLTCKWQSALKAWPSVCSTESGLKVQPISGCQKNKQGTNMRLTLLAVLTRRAATHAQSHNAKV